MNVLERRRAIMMMLGGQAMVGKLTRYHTETVRFTENAAHISVQNPFGEDFKFFRIYATVPPTDFGSVISCAGDGDIGGQLSLNWSTGNDNYTTLKRWETSGNVPTNNSFIVHSDLFIFGRPGGSYFYAKDTEYIVELYA